MKSPRLPPISKRGRSSGELGGPPIPQSGPAGPTPRRRGARKCDSFVLQSTVLDVYREPMPAIAGSPVHVEHIPASYRDMLKDHPHHDVRYWDTHMCASFMVDDLGLNQIDEIGIDKVT